MSQRPLRPVHICLFITACLLSLALMREDHLFDSHQNDVVIDSLYLDVVDTLSIPVEDTIYKHPYLANFYRALQHADSMPVRVVHYGDSQIEEDRITMQLRRCLQQQYGGGGVGIVPLHQTIPTLTLEQALYFDSIQQSVKEGPKRYLVYGPKTMHRDNAYYGVMGQVAMMDNDLVAGSEDIQLHMKEYNHTKANTEVYFNRIRVLSKGNIQVSGLGKHIGNGLYRVNDSTYNATIHLQGKGEVYGISLETDRGVIVDNIPMRGGQGTVFTSIDSTQLRSYFASTNTALIILQFGGNALTGLTKSSYISLYTSNMRNQIQYLKRMAPNSSILFIGPSDMCERIDGEWQTNRLVEILDRALQQMAAQEQIAYFSMFQSMGGTGSMIKWKDQGLAGNDYIHFTVKGAEKAGKMLSEWIL